MSKTKSFPPSVNNGGMNGGHYPSQQSIEMNPYIDEQFIFQPQTMQQPMGSPQSTIHRSPMSLPVAQPLSINHQHPLNASVSVSPYQSAVNSRTPSISHSFNSPQLMPLQPTSIMTTNSEVYSNTTSPMLNRTDINYFMSNYFYFPTDWK